MVIYGQCPRCGQWSLEHLKTHSHCWECNYFPEPESELELWHCLEFRKSKNAAQRRTEEERILQGKNLHREVCK